MKILALDSSGPVAAVALAEETENGSPRLIGGFRLQSGFTHSQTLMPMLEHMKALARFDLADIDYIAVASGPGSFTGLRIGASAAKGLAFALNKPVVPVPTLSAMAYQMAGTPGLVCPMLDARRQQVYAGVFTFAYKEATAGEKPANREVGWHMETVREAGALPVQELIAALNRLGGVREDNASPDEKPVVYFLGDGVPVYLTEIETGLSLPYSVVPFHRDRQSAEAVCALAFEMVKEGRAVEADKFVPEYLRSGPQPAV